MLTLLSCETGFTRRMVPSAHTLADCQILLFLVIDSNIECYGCNAISALRNSSVTRRDQLHLGQQAIW